MFTKVYILLPYLFQLTVNLCHACLVKRINQDDEDGGHRNAGRDETHEVFQAFEGFGGLDSSFGGVVAKGGQQGHDCPTGDGATKLLGHGAGGENETSGGGTVLQLGIVGHIGVHAPYKRRDDAGEDGDDDLQEHHQPPAEAVVGHEEEEDAEEYQGAQGEDVGGLLAELQGERYGEGDTNHVAHFAHHEEETGIEHEGEHAEIEEGIGGDVVLEEIGGGGSAHGVEEVGAQGGAIEYPPRGVVYKGFQVFADGGAFDGGLDVFLCHAEAEQEAAKADAGNDNHGALPAAGIGEVHGLEPVAQGFPKAEGDEATSVGEEHAVGGEHGLGVGIVRHHAEHGSVGHVDSGIDGHHEDVGDVCPDELASGTHVGGGEQQDAGDGKGYGYPEEVGTVFAPTGVGAVGNDAHHGVGHGVPDAGDEHQETGVCQA